jgi:hypothetical protein
MRDGVTLLFTVSHWDYSRISIKFIGSMILVSYRFKSRWLTLGYNHIPYFNCPASKKCRGCDAGKFFGSPLIRIFGPDYAEGTGLGPENCKPLWDKIVGQGTGQKKGWRSSM